MIDYEVKSHWGVLGTKKYRDDVQEVRLCKVSWNGGKPTWDLRCWSADEKPQKGLTLTDEMMKNLADILASVDFGK